MTICKLELRIKALQITGRLWADEEMNNVKMEDEAVFGIAEIIERLLCEKWNEK